MNLSIVVLRKSYLMTAGEEILNNGSTGRKRDRKLRVGPRKWFVFWGRKIVTLIWETSSIVKLVTKEWMGRAGGFWFSFVYVEGRRGRVDNRFALNMLSSSVWETSRSGCPIVTILGGRLGLMMCSDFYCKGFHSYILTFSTRVLKTFLLMYPFQEYKSQTNRKLYTFSYI